MLAKCPIQSFRHLWVNFRNPIPFGLLRIVLNGSGRRRFIFNLVYKPEANQPNAKIEDLPSELKSAG
jgi:hypothetical protein